MILNLSFANFRSFKTKHTFTMEPTASKAKENNLCILKPEIAGKIPVLKISLIYGANASGKTNIVKLLYGLRRWVLNRDNRFGEDIPLYAPFKFDIETQHSPTEIWIDFLINKIKYKYYISFDRHSVLSETLSYYPNGRPTLLYERLTGADNYDTIKYGASLTYVKPFNVFKNQLVLSKFLADTPVQHITEAALYFSEMVISNGYQEDIRLGVDDEIMRWIHSNPIQKIRLEEFLAFADTGVAGLKFEKRIEGFDVSGIHPLFSNGELKGNTELPLREESFGTRALLLIGGRMLKALETGSPFLIDEMDSGLHTYITQLIVDIFRNNRINKNNAQLIFTTHDVNLLKQDTLRKDQIWFTEKNNKGESDLFPLSDFSDVRENTPFAQWYENNKFGGVPSLKPLEQLFQENEI